MPKSPEWAEAVAVDEAAVVAAVWTAVAARRAAGCPLKVAQVVEAAAVVAVGAAVAGDAAAGAISGRREDRPKVPK